MKAYGTSKLMTIMSNTEMVRRLKGSGIDSFICQPGMASTPVYGKTDKSHVMANVLDAAQKVMGQTEERGATPLLYTATAPEMSGGSPATPTPPNQLAQHILDTGFFGKRHHVRKAAKSCEKNWLTRIRYTLVAW